LLEGLPDLPPSTTELREILTNDVAEHWLRLKRDDSEANRRAYVRAAFALIEGFVAIMKQHALAELKTGRVTLTPGELVLLLEKSYSASDAGEVTERGAFIPTPQNIKFAFAVFAKSHQASRAPDYTDHRWGSLVKAIRVRNRITHPRSASDMEVSPEEVGLVDDAWAWFLDASFDVYVEGRAQLLAKLQLQGLGTVTP
jgi:hypothetical protein